MNTRMWTLVVTLTAAVCLLVGFGAGWFGYQAYLAASLNSLAEELEADLGAAVEEPDEDLDEEDGESVEGQEPVSIEQELVNAAAMGEAASDGIWEITVKKAEREKTVSGSYSNAVASDGFEFLILHVTVENVSNAPQMPDFSESQVVDGDGRSFAYHWDAGVALDEDDVQYMDVNPSQTVEARIPFEVPEDVTMVGARLTGSWDGGRAVFDLGEV